jgi:hypothetical protein
MDSRGHVLSFPTPTHTHVSNTNSHVYGHFGIATCGVQRFAENRFDELVETFGTVMDSDDIMTFKLVINLI